MESTFLWATKDLYVTWFSVVIDPDKPGFGETEWITSEDVNVEHLLDVFTSIDPNSDYTWISCNGFVAHLHWHKPRKTVLGPKIEQLPDDYRWKPTGLFELSGLFPSVGNHVGEKRILLVR